jgi:hypothetical protein
MPSGCQGQALKTLNGQSGSLDARRRMEDVAYTLCISTGTREAETALHTARRQLGMADGAPAFRSLKDA